MNDVNMLICSKVIVIIYNGVWVDNFVDKKWIFDEIRLRVLYVFVIVNLSMR